MSSVRTIDIGGGTDWGEVLGQALALALMVPEFKRRQKARREGEAWRTEGERLAGEGTQGQPAVSAEVPNPWLANRQSGMGNREGGTAGLPGSPDYEAAVQEITGPLMFRPNQRTVDEHLRQRRGGLLRGWAPAEGRPYAEGGGLLGRLRGEVERGAAGGMTMTAPAIPADPMAGLRGPEGQAWLTRGALRGYPEAERVRGMVEPQLSPEERLRILRIAGGLEPEVVGPATFVDIPEEMQKRYGLPARLDTRLGGAVAPAVAGQSREDVARMNAAARLRAAEITAGGMWQRTLAEVAGRDRAARSRHVLQLQQLRERYVSNMAEDGNPGWQSYVDDLDMQIGMLGTPSPPGPLSQAGEGGAGAGFEVTPTAGGGRRIMGQPVGSGVMSARPTSAPTGGLPPLTVGPPALGGGTPPRLVAPPGGREGAKESGRDRRARAVAEAKAKKEAEKPKLTADRASKLADGVRAYFRFVQGAAGYGGMPATKQVMGKATASGRGRKETVATWSTLTQAQRDDVMRQARAQYDELEAAEMVPAGLGKPGSSVAPSSAKATAGKATQRHGSWGKNFSRLDELNPGKGFTALAKRLRGAGVSGPEIRTRLEERRAKW